MTNILSITTIVSLILAAGAIEDCGGHCLGNDNWPMFFAMFGTMIVSGVLTIYFMSKETA